MMKIGLCHGVFDVVHLGHVKHFESAKKIVDFLVVSVTDDKYVKKGLNRPLFNTQQRIDFLKSIKLIDEVILSNSDNAIQSLKKIKPHFYFKGGEYIKKESKGFNSFDLEKNYCKKSKIKIIYTLDSKFSSSSIINSYKNENKILTDSISIIKKKYSLSQILEIFNSAILKSITVLGDPIVDKYRYGQTVGTSSKSPSLALLQENVEDYMGGSLAVAEMLSALGCKVNLLFYKSILHAEILRKINKKINQYNLFSLKEYPVIERIVDEARFTKLLQIYNLDRIILNDKHESKIIKTINFLNKKNNFFLITDFGFGMINDRIVNFFNKSKINYSINCHLNALNVNFNYYDKYKKFNLITFNKKEFNMSFKGNFNFEQKLTIARKIIKPNSMFAVTLGLKGAILCYKNEVQSFPAIFTKIVDPVGCGDAYFAMTSIIKNVTSDLILINFLGNLYAGLHGQIICNKSFVDKKNFLNNLKCILS